MKDNRIELLKTNIKVWCLDRNQWETDELEMLGTGDFVDSKNRLHCKEHHIPYVGYQNAIMVAEQTEQDIKDRAISVYRNLCPYRYRDGRCSFNNYKNCIHTKCDQLKLFAELLDKEE